MTRRDLRRQQVGHGRRGEPSSGVRTSGRRALDGLTSKQLAALVASVASFVALTGCGGADSTDAARASTGADAVVALADLQVSDSSIADDPMLVAPSSTAAPAASSTAAPTTAADTLAPTTVVTLPVPAAPPAPRANEPYVELGRIEIPRIDVDTLLLQGITLTTLDQGPGHWPGTALPGQLGNAVIAGHRTSHDKVFRNVDQLLPGDEVIFTTDEGRFVYVVSETTIVKPDAMYIIDQTPEHTATLFACHPPGSTRERIVVHLDLASSESAAETAGGAPAEAAA